MMRGHTYIKLLKLFDFDSGYLKKTILAVESLQHQIS